MERTSSGRPGGARAFLLVGGNGFLGRHVSGALAAGWRVRVFDRPGSGPPAAGVEFYPGDLGNSGELDRAMEGCEGFAYLVHETGLSPYLDSDRLALARNIELFLLAIESARRCGVGKVVLFSSGGAVYGMPETMPVPETHPRRPISAYGVAKGAMEMYLHAAARSANLDHLVVRPSNPYGPGQHPARLQGVVSVFAGRILKGEPIEVWGDGTTRKDYLYVGDMADAVAALVAEGFDNRAYNIGSGTGASLMEIIALVEKAAGCKAVVKRLPARANDVPEFTLDTTRLAARTGWRPRTSLEDGVRRTVAWIAQGVS